MIINTQQILSIARWIISVGGGFAIGKGWITTEHLATIGDKLPEIIGGLAALATLIWGVANKTNRATVVQASNVPGVKAVVVDTTSTTAAVPSVVAAAESRDNTAPKVVPG